VAGRSAGLSHCPTAGAGVATALTSWAISLSIEVALNMSGFKVLSKLFRDGGRRVSSRPRRPVRAQPALQALDERSLPSATFVQTNLVSDLPGVARVQDPPLLDPVGIALDTVHPAGQSFGFAIPALLSNRGEVFALGGNSLLRSTSVDLGSGEPTDVVFNTTASATDFSVTGALATRPAAFLFATGQGQIVAWNPQVGEQDNNGNILTFSLTGHVEFTAPDLANYTGLALGKVGAANFLYAADLGNRKIDVIDGQFHKVALGTNGFEAFTDPNQPAGYRPTNVQNINGRLYVTYNSGGTTPPDPAAGNGFIDVFETNGHFDGRLVSGGDLNDPYGLALAPAGFGDFGGALLVGNIIDGRIHAYNPTTGAELGTLNGPNGQPLTIPALHGLVFGAGAGKVGDANTLYFTAAPDQGQHGLFGSIAVNPGTAPRVTHVVVGDGTAQRSMVTQIQVAFDQHVVLPATAADAFRLTRQGDGAAVNLTAAVDDLGAGTVVTLTFVGGAVDPSLLNDPSLADGRYTLTVLAGRVAGPNGALDGNGDSAGGDDFGLAGDPANGLFRLFGDATGDGAVDNADFFRLKQTFLRSAGDPLFLGALDFNGDATVDNADFFQFRLRFGRAV
jgi:uncharacterized protein (TIGR03118 family)